MNINIYLLMFLDIALELYTRWDNYLYLLIAGGSLNPTVSYRVSWIGGRVTCTDC